MSNTPAQRLTYLAASARETTKSTLSASDVDASLMSMIVAIGLLYLRCISRSIATLGNSVEPSVSTGEAPRIKFKRLDKTSRHIMQACIYILIIHFGKIEFVLFC